MVTGMLYAFHVDTYVLLDLGSNISFVTPFIAMNFSVSHEILSNPFSVSTPIGESMVSIRICRNYPSTTQTRALS